MKRNVVLVLVVAGVLSACSSTPERIAELDEARTAVAKVEASPRAGVAAANISAARQSLNRANNLAEAGKDVDDIAFESTIATRQAQIADEKIAFAQYKDDFEKGNAERQQVLLEARNAEADAARQRAAQMEEELKALQAKKTDRGMILTLGDVLFDTGKSTLKPGAYSTIDKLAQVLKQSPDRKLLIEGHTDSTGSDATNMALSQQRALSVQAALMERGVSAQQIAAVGKGESTPVASNDNAGGRQQNRRVELIFSQDEGRLASDRD
jgi:outer membrane protein OmpA-like peptidoglycan-associated protein